MKNITKSLFVIFLIAMAPVYLAAQDPTTESAINEPDSPIQFFGYVEGGAVKVLYHVFQSGESSTAFNFVTQGGQEILFPYNRVVLGATYNDRHMVSFLYQPLTLETTVRFREDVTIDNQTFAADTSMQLSYGFPFWRFTYGYDLLPGMKNDVYVGAAIQLRNASISFVPVDGGSSGSAATVNQNLGIVPALFTSAKHRFDSGIELYFEATGIYASSAFFNGADFEFTGSLLDTSLRASFPLKHGASTFVNLRFLGGTSNGVSQYPDLYWTKAIEDFGMNNLATMSFTAGIEIH